MSDNEEDCGCCAGEGLCPDCKGMGCVECGDDGDCPCCGGSGLEGGEDAG